MKLFVPHRNSTRFVSSRTGATAVLVAAAGLLLIALVGLTIDTAYVRRTNQELQVAADAAALAGAASLLADPMDPDFTLVRQAAIDTAARNRAAARGVALSANVANEVDGDIVVGTWDRISQTFTPGTQRPNAVRVVAARTDESDDGPLPLIFGPAFQVGSSQVSRSAIATLAPGPFEALLVLHPTLPKAFDQRGNAELYVPFNGIHVDSNDKCGFYLNGQPEIPRVNAGFVNVVGNYCTPVGAVDPQPKGGSEYIPDPLANVPAPSPVGMQTFTAKVRSPGNLAPGYYPGGIDLNSGITSLSPGIYYVGGNGIDLTGDALLRGDEVMLYLAQGATLKTAGNAAGLDLGAPTEGPYEGIVVFYDRANTTTCSISGGGLFDVRGTMYLRSAELEMDGNVDRVVGRIIVNTIQFRGNGRYTITGRGVTDEPLYPILVD